MDPFSRLKTDIRYIEQLLERVAATPRLTRHDRQYRRILRNTLAGKRARLANLQQSRPAQNLAA